MCIRDRVKIARYFGMIEVEHVCVYRLDIIIGHIYLEYKFQDVLFTGTKQCGERLV